MREPVEILGVDPDPSFRADLADLLVARLLAPGGAEVGGEAVVELDADTPSGTAEVPPWRRRRRYLAIVAAGVLLVAALAVAVVRRGRSAVPAQPGPSTTVADATVLGPARVATGAPVTVGFVSDVEEAGVFTSAEAATAAAAYVDAHLGGLAGRPIRLVSCTTGDVASDADARACAERLVADGAVAILQGRSVRGLTVQSIAAVAGIPFVVYESADGAGQVADSYQLTSFSAVGLAAVELAVEARAVRAAVVLPDGALGQALKLAIEPFYAAGGVTASYVFAAPDGRDLDAVVRAVLSSTASQVQLGASDPLCLPLYSALRSAGYRGTVVVTQGCLDTDDALGGGADLRGVLRVTRRSSDPGAPEQALYRAVLRTYANDPAPEGRYASSGYAVVLGFARAVSGLTGDVTPETVRVALTTMAPQPLPLFDGQTFRCAAHGQRGTTADCSQVVSVAELGADGVAVRSRPLSMVSRLGG